MQDYCFGCNRTPTPTSHYSYNYIINDDTYSSKKHHSHKHITHNKYNYENDNKPREVTKSPNQPKKFSKTQNKRIPKESSPFSFFIISGICILIQLVLIQDSRFNLSRPTENELPLAAKINNFFDSIPLFDRMYDFTDRPKEILLICVVIFNFYRVFSSTSESSLVSFIISILILFDKKTYELMILNPSFGIQLILISNCVLNCQNIIVLEPFSSSWISSSLISVLFAFFASFINIEAFPIFIPIIVSILFLSKSSKRKQKTYFIVKIFNFLTKIVFLIILFSISFVVNFAFVSFLIEYPKAFFNEIIFSFDLDFLKDHNVLFLLIAVLALRFFFLTDIECLWLFSFIVGLLVTVLMKFSFDVNDLEVKAGLAVYYYLLSCGFVLTEPRVRSISSMILIIYLIVVLFSYINLI